MSNTIIDETNNKIDTSSYILDSNEIENDIGISVIIPLYNGIEFLEEAIQSVVDQTYSNWELIIGINGFEQNSPVEIEANIIRDKFINEKNKIYVKHYITKGAPLTLNALAQDANNSWIAFLDADDYWEKTKLEKQVKYVDTYDVIGTHGKYVGNWNFLPSIPVNDISSHDIFKINPMLHSSILIKKELVQFEDHFVYDYNLWFKLFYEKKKFFNIAQVLLYHRVHNNSAFNNKNQQYLKELKLKWRDVYNYTKQLQL